MNFRGGIPAGRIISPLRAPARREESAAIDTAELPAYFVSQQSFRSKRGKGGTGTFTPALKILLKYIDGSPRGSVFARFSLSLSLARRFQTSSKGRMAREATLISLFSFLFSSRSAYRLAPG